MLLGKSNDFFFTLSKPILDKEGKRTTIPVKTFLIKNYILANVTVNGLLLTAY